VLKVGRKSEEDSKRRRLEPEILTIHTPYEPILHPRLMFKTNTRLPTFVAPLIEVGQVVKNSLSSTPMFALRVGVQASPTLRHVVRLVVASLRLEQDPISVLSNKVNRQISIDRLNRFIYIAYLSGMRFIGTRSSSAPPNNAW
jgi:hypothetical protein